MSRSFDFRSGVGTQMITTSLRSSTGKSGVASYRSAQSDAIRSPLSTSGLCERPMLRAATLSGSVSRPATRNPARANSTARGRPTQPLPDHGDVRVVIPNAVDQRSLSHCGYLTRCSRTAWTSLGGSRSRKRFIRTRRGAESAGFIRVRELERAPPGAIRRVRSSPWQTGQTANPSGSPIDTHCEATLAPAGPTGFDVGHAVPSEYDLNRLEQDLQVQPKRHVPKIIEVVADLLHLLLEGVRVPIVDLRPAGDSRPDRAPERVVRNRVARHLVQIADGQDHELEIRQWVRPWTYEVHVATEDVDELWKLVEPEPPEQPPDACDPIIVVPLPLRRRPADRPHSAELHQLEGSPTHSHALLDEEHGAAGVELDEKHDQTEDRRQHDQSDDRREEAERPRERVLQT